MKKLFALTSAALALGLPAFAQSEETVNNSPTTPSQTTIAAPVVRAPVNTGSTKATVIQAFGPYITQTGVGGGGADVSELYTTVGYNVYGFGAQNVLGLAVADDVVVPAGGAAVATLKWLSYQTSAPTTGTMNGLYFSLWNADPVGQGYGSPNVVLNDGINHYTSHVWTGVYRPLDTGLTSTARAIMEVTADASSMGVLAGGTWWIGANFSGTSSSGPWAPPVTVVGQTPGSAIYNGRQYIPASSGGTDTFQPLTDSGNLDTIDLLFQLEGPGGAGELCGPSPSSSGGCVAVWGGVSANVTKGGSGAVAPCGSVAAGVAGMLILSDQGGPVGAPGAYGQLCVGGGGSIGVKRANCTFTSSGGTSGCTGNFNWNLQCAVDNTAALTAGMNAFIQGWVRDPGAPAKAIFTSGYGPIPVL